MNHKTTRTRQEILSEWSHAMRMEFLRVPIMVPIWWLGMQGCGVLWHRLWGS